MGKRPKSGKTKSKSKSRKTTKNWKTRKTERLFFYLSIASLAFPVVTGILAVSFVLQKTKPLVKTSIMHAANEGNLQELREELKDSLSQHSNEEIARALNLAAAHGHKRVIEYLLKLGANPNGMASTNSLANHPLSEAVKAGQTAIVESLLKHGASAKMRDTQGNTAMHWAAIYSFPEMMHILLSYQAPLNMKNGYNRTPLMEAANMGHQDVVNLLTKNGATLEDRDIQGDTALSLAKKNQHNQLVLSLEKMSLDRRIATQNSP